MGQPKLLLPWRKTTVVGHVLGIWRELGASQLGVVTSPKSAVLAELDRLQVGEHRILNTNPELGMFESIRCAARWSRWSPDITHFALVLGDQPQVQTSTLQALLDFAAAHPSEICQPSRNGRGRHPVILPRAIFKTIAGSTAPHLKDFMMRQPNPPTRIELPDAGLDLDIDTPEDYARAVASIAG
jgi:CTP:molybdopterin cytidylyltransferase MocA